jgi:hypothetical protein
MGAEEASYEAVVGLRDKSEWIPVSVQVWPPFFPQLPTEMVT